jgi:DMSO/TMAO reductase YedYZ heme-binding membrane subunit
MIRRLGKAWPRLHRLVYPLTALALLHFFLQAVARPAATLSPRSGSGAVGTLKRCIRRQPIRART